MHNDINSTILTIECQLSKIGKEWQDDVLEELISCYGQNKGRNMYITYKSAFTLSYQYEHNSRDAVNDIKYIQEIINNNAVADFNVKFSQALEENEDKLFLRIYLKNKQVVLSDILPTLENIGMKVINENPYTVNLTKHSYVVISKFSLAVADIKFNYDAIMLLLEDALKRIYSGQIENDCLNQLILKASLEVRQVFLIRALSRYLLQTGIVLNQKNIESAIINQAEVIKKLIRLFDIKFNPSINRASDLEEKICTENIIEQLHNVTDINQDKILRALLDIVKSIIRTNFYQKDNNGEYKNYLSFKIKPDLILDMPKPIPMFETFVYSKDVEGVHLRYSKVARGGLRWSDRIDDYRTEVLGLVKAQQVKNALIVPQGAKGGFVSKSVSNNGDHEHNGIASYKIFICGLLDLADNIKNGQIVKPEKVICYDDDDPYFVVAADKGTATFSDIANGVAKTYDFWLDDAFASGGSNGYDHKKWQLLLEGHGNLLNSILRN